MSKRGISGIVVALILILLALVAAGIIWVVIRSTVSEGVEEVSLGKFLIDLNIERAYIEGNNLVVNVKRNPGAGDLIAINFVVSDDSETEVVRQDTDLNEYEGREFNFTLQNINLSSIKEISVVPVYVSGGKETLGSITDTYNVGEESLEEIEGDGIGETGGTCTDEETQSCPFQNGVCSGSLQTCTGGSWPGCDYTPISEYELTEITCNDGLDNDCDGNTDTADSNCQISGCTPAPDPTLPGICGARECGNAENGTCGTVSCGDCQQLYGSVYICDTDTGQCVVETSVNSGIIYSVWPSDAPKYLESENLPKSSEGYNYIGYFVKFPGSAETGCIMITYFDYLAQNDRSYIRLDRVATIASPDNYEIWATQQGCEGV